MVKLSEVLQARQDARRAFSACGISLTDEEVNGMDVADFGLGNFKLEGGQMATFFCTTRVSTKIIYLYPGQTLPQHWHISEGYGKEETLRVIGGTLYMCSEGDDTLHFAQIPPHNDIYYTCRHETVMQNTDQITFMPGEKHWFQGGPQGAVIFSFSNCAIDALDPFENPNIIRTTVISEG